MSSSGVAGPSVHLQANTEVLEIVEGAKSASATVRALPTGKTSVDAYDFVILCTGFDEDTVLDSPLFGPELEKPH